MLEDWDLDELEVEIYDPHKAFMPSLFPISPKDPYIAVYEAFGDKLVQYVDGQLGRQWTSMCLYKVGNRVEAAICEIVIMVQPFTRHDWQHMSRTIMQNLVSKHQLHGQNIGVQFMPGQSGFLPPTEENPGLSFKDTLKEFPAMGSSIGVKGERGGGTLGGYMSMTMGNNTARGFLTNCHVVEPAHSSEASVKDAFYKFGVSSTTKMNAPTRSSIHTMALKDIDATVKDIQKAIDAYTKPDRLSPEQVERGESLGIIPHLQNKMDEMAMFGKDTSAQNLQLTAARRSLDAMRERLEICHEQPTTIGDVHWASGRALRVSTDNLDNSSKSILDFAFVRISDSKLQNHCVSDNQLPLKSEFKLLPEDYNRYGCEASKPHIGTPRVADFGEIRKVSNPLIP